MASSSPDPAARPIDGPQRREFFRSAVGYSCVIELPGFDARLDYPSHDRGDDRPDDRSDDRTHDHRDDRPHDQPGDRPYGHRHDESDDDAVPSSGSRQLFRLADLSGGGCSCIDPTGRLKLGRVCRMRLKLPGATSLSLEVQVVRRAWIEGLPAAGLRFVKCRERDRERILRALFAEYRRQRAEQSEEDQG